jgi:hypothetical protein
LLPHCWLTICIIYPAPLQAARERRKRREAKKKAKVLLRLLDASINP